MRAFLFFLSFDLISKYLAAVIAPDNAFFKLHYNTNLLFNYDGGFFMTYIFPLLALPLVVLVMNKVSPRSVPLMLAGIIGNLICRLLPSGVVDFLNFQLFINNFADIYIWVAYGIALLDFYRMNQNKFSEKSLPRETI